MRYGILRDIVGYNDNFILSYWLLGVCVWKRGIREIQQIHGQTIACSISFKPVHFGVPWVSKFGTPSQGWSFYFSKLQWGYGQFLDKAICLKKVRKEYSHENHDSFLCDIPTANECIWNSYTYTWVCGHGSFCHVLVCLLNYVDPTYPF